MVKKKFLGKYAISAEEFSEEMVPYITCIRIFLFSHKKNLMKPAVTILVFFPFGHSLTFLFSKVGAKSRNIAYLKGKVPSWVGVPTSVAIPFGTFEKVLSDGLNKVSSWFFFDII